MRAKKIDASREILLEPEAAEWQGVAGEEIPLKGTPLGLQPSPYVKASWRNQEIGKVKQVRVKSLHNGTEIFFHLEWKDPVENREIVNANVFPDAAGLLFPVKEDAPLVTMGSKTQPVTAWYWRSDRDGKGNCNVAHGLGTTEVVDECPVYCKARWSRGRWQVVIGAALRPSKAGAEVVRFEPGSESRVAVAVWEGGNGERAGIKAFSEVWQTLELEG